MGSLRDMQNGRGERTARNTKTTVYTYNSTGETSSMVFRCPRCGGHHLTEVITEATVRRTISKIGMSNDEDEITWEYNEDLDLVEEGDNDDGEYECGDCRHRLDIKMWWLAQP
jgi:hypothetical protein